jgi:hypothetical protein
VRDACSIADIPDDIRAALEAGTKLTNEQKKTYDKIQKKNARNAVRKVCAAVQIHLQICVPHFVITPASRHFVCPQAQEQQRDSKRKKEETREAAAKRREDERALERKKKVCGADRFSTTTRWRRKPDSASFAL